MDRRCSDNEGKSHAIERSSCFSGKEYKSGDLPRNGYVEMRKLGLETDCLGQKDLNLLCSASFILVVSVALRLKPLFYWCMKRGIDEGREGCVGGEEERVR